MPANCTGLANTKTPIQYSKLGFAPISEVKLCFKILAPSTVRDVQSLGRGMQGAISSSLACPGVLELYLQRLAACPACGKNDPDQLCQHLFLAAHSHTCAPTGSMVEPWTILPGKAPHKKDVNDTGTDIG